METDPLKRFVWDAAKNAWLKHVRGISFEEILEALAEGGLLDTLEHPNPKYTGQKLLVVKIKEYVHLVPFEETGDEIHLKTIIPSRKQTKKYGGAK